MYSPFSLPPDPAAQDAAREVTARVHAYMEAHPESELHKQGKMFGVLVYASEQPSEDSRQIPFIAAFSAKLDGSYHHEGFVPPVYEMPSPPVGKSREESQRLQRLLFANYRFLNRAGEEKDLLELFEKEPRIIPPEEFFNRQSSGIRLQSALPPSGAGECCAPKLLQYAFLHHLEPIGLAEFWVGAPSRTEVRQEGVFYAPCSGKCVPILRHMLSGIEFAQTPENERLTALCEQTKVLYEDEAIMVVNKPSGLLSVPGKGEEPSVVSYLAQKYHLAYLQAAHRLDQDTSGVMVIAKNALVHRALGQQFEQREVKKRYVALLEGTLTVTHGEICLPLGPDLENMPHQQVDFDNGKEAVTRFEVVAVEQSGNVTRVFFYPQTGRTHQLRVHSAAPEGLNAPIVGDRLYGHVADRLYLHAESIKFVHPLTKEEMHFCLPAPF